MTDINIGTRVQRCNTPSGKAPAYRFVGTVCGSYTNPVTGDHGWCVSLDHDPGCIQIFPAYMLEAAPDDLQQILTDLAANQTRLGAEFEAVWEANTEELYQK